MLVRYPALDDDPFFGRIRPLDDLYSLVTRNEVGIDGRVCEAPAWQHAHTVTVAEALPIGANIDLDRRLEVTAHQADQVVAA